MSSTVARRRRPKAKKAPAIQLVMPRVCRVPKAKASPLGWRAVKWARSIGMKLDAEQEFVLKKSLGLDARGRWQAFEVGINAPRQNGKGEVLMARELYGLFVLKEPLLVHSAHEFKTSSRHFDRMEALVRSRPELMSQLLRSQLGGKRMLGFRYTHGDEAMELHDGRKIEFRTRTKAGLKGFDNVACLVLDEAQILSEWAHGTMVPTLRASTAERGPQLWYAGNAADQERDDHAVVWTRLRERGIAGDDPSLVYFEWSLDYDSPDELPDEVLEDHDSWREVNWAIDRGRIELEHMDRELRTLGQRQFAVELLGVGDYPDIELAQGSIINLETWEAIEEPDSVLEDPICLAFDVSPGRRSSIVAAGQNERGRIHIEVVYSRAGTAWVPDEIEALCGRHDVLEVACDGFGPANSIANRVEEQAGLKVRRLKTGEYADACGTFTNEIEEQNVVHIGQEELTTAVRGARTRPLVDRWAWSRSKSRTDPGPLIAATIALYSAQEQSFGEMNIW